MNRLASTLAQPVTSEIARALVSSDSAELPSPRTTSAPTATVSGTSMRMSTAMAAAYKPNCALPDHTRHNNLSLSPAQPSSDSVC
mmetsp:Transcript_24472/g.52921  ORF Transcript_24472/g.52921 Transcript_24472/m.52921 type:complete len:85 (-) Transcript_24472:82-336(-)